MDTKKRHNVLFIEDDEVQLEIYKRWLNLEFDQEFDLSSAHTLGDGLKLLSNHEFDIVLLDLDLPDSSHIETFLIIHEKFPELPIIILSGLADRELSLEAVKLGAQDFMVKNEINSFILERSINHAIERKKLEQKIQRYVDIVDNMQVGLYVYQLEDINDDRTLRMVMVNDAAEKIMGILKKDILGKRIDEIFPNFREKGLPELYAKVIREQKAVELNDIDYKNNDDIQNYFHVRTFPLPKNCIGVLFESTTKSELAKLALKESEEKYRTLFEDSKDIIFESTPDGKILDMNPAGMEKFGYSSKDELKKINIPADIYFDKNDWIVYQKKMGERGFVKDFEINYKNRNGEKIIALETATAIKNSAQKIIAYRGIAKDITSRVKNAKLLEKMNEELKKSNAQLKQSQATIIQQEKLASIGQLAAGIAHELNNPIGFITNNFKTLQHYLIYLKEYLDHLEKFTAMLNEVVEFPYGEQLQELFKFRKKRKIGYILSDIETLFQESTQGFERILTIVQGLKNYARTESDDVTVTYDLNQAIEETLIVARNEVKYVADVKTKLGDIPLIECNRGEINQVLLNIIVNAAQAIDSQQKDRLGLIEIETLQKEDDVYCTIKDNGPGIPKDVLQKIFEPFFTTKELGKGTGLGLSISYNIIVNKHNGDLAVESVPGNGTSFIIKLPIHPVSKESSPETVKLDSENQYQ